MSRRNTFCENSERDVFMLNLDASVLHRDPFHNDITAKLCSLAIDDYEPKILHTLNREFTKSLKTSK